MRGFLIPLLLLASSGCGTAWTLADGDGDGLTVLDGDCWDFAEGPAGSGLTGADIHPGADETWYDGYDQDCDGGDDFDQDLDGYRSALHGGDDCWDTLDAVPSDYQALAGYSQPGADEVNPASADVLYDGIDQDCAGDSDFDGDGDGYDSAAQPQRDGSYGDDCYDLSSDAPPEDPTCTPTGGDELLPEDVYPGADDAVYDGIDQDCAGDSDFDADGDGYATCEECDDTDAERYPNPDIPEVWYDGDDQNCDGNDGDQDGDGWYAADYPFEVPDNYSAGDCWDDPTSIPTGFDAINDLPQPDASGVHPTAVDDLYDGVDADCAGDSDFDGDDDGFATTELPARDGTFGTDCADDDMEINPSADELWYDGVDANCDGADDYDQDRDGQSATGYGSTGDGFTDCNDLSDSVYLGADEACDGTDSDCDGSDNDADADGCTTLYADVDGDSYGDGDDSACLCATTGTYTATTSDDCDDGDAGVNPGASELCSTTGVDDDCDGSADEFGAADCSTWYYDADNDGYGADGGYSRCQCTTQGNYRATVQGDCDDTASTVSPAATEVCDEQDNDCDDQTDEGVTSSYYPDDDGDGFGDASGTVDACAAPGGYVDNGDDCDDTDDAVNPDATEVCNGGTDDDCDASTTENDRVSLETTGGAWSDATSTYTGTPSAPVAVALPSSGTVHFCAGTYYVNLTATSSTVTLDGAGATTTILDGGGTGTVLSVNGGRVNARDLRLTNGSATSGGAVLATRSTTPTAANLTLTNCEVTGSTATYGGGIAVTSYGWLSLVDTEVSGNTATSAGAGIWVDDTALLDADGADIGSNAACATCGGGGIYADGGTSRASVAQVSLVDSDIHDNTAKQGAGLYVHTYAQVEMQGTLVYGNTTTNNGAGVYIYTAGIVTCADSSARGGGVYHNTGTGGGGVWFGSTNNSQASFSSTGCDFGTSADGDDNSPNDVQVYGGSSYTSFGTNASFTCDKDGSVIICQ